MAYNKYFDSISSNTGSDGSVFLLDTSQTNFERFKINSSFVINDLTTSLTASNQFLNITGSIKTKDKAFFKNEILSNGHIKVGNATFTLESNKISASLSSGIFDFPNSTVNFESSKKIASNTITGSLKNINGSGDTFFETSDDSTLDYNLGWTLNTGRKAPEGNIVKIGFDPNDWLNVSNSDIVDYRDSGNNLNFRNDELEETNILYYRPGYTNGNVDLEYLNNLFDGAFFKFEITGANGVLPGWSTGSNDVLSDVSEYSNLGISDDVKMQNQTIMIDLSDAVDNGIIAQDYEIFFEFHDHKIPPVVTHALWHSKSDDDGVGYNFPNSGSVGNGNSFNNNDFCFTSIHCHPEDTYYQNNKNNDLFGKEELGKLMNFTLFDSSDDGNEFENKFLPVTHTGTTLVTSKPRLLLNLGAGSSILSIESDDLNKSSLYLQRVYNDSGITKEPVISNDNFISAGEVSSYSDSFFDVTFNAFFNPTSDLSPFNYLRFMGFRATANNGYIYSKSAIKNNKNTEYFHLNYNRIFPCKIYDEFVSGGKLTLSDIPANIKNRLPTVTKSALNTNYYSQNNLPNLDFSGTSYSSDVKKKYLNLDLCSVIKENFYNKISSDWSEYKRIKNNLFNNINNKISNNIVHYQNINNINSDSGLRINKLTLHIPYIKIKEKTNTYNHLNNFSNNGSLYSLNNFINSYSNYAQSLNPANFGSNKYQYISDSFIQGEWLQYEKNKFGNRNYTARVLPQIGSFVNKLDFRTSYYLGFIVTNGLNRPEFYPSSLFRTQFYRYMAVDLRGLGKINSAYQNNGSRTQANNYFNICTSATLKLIGHDDFYANGLRSGSSIDQFLASKMPLNFKEDIEIITPSESDPSDKFVYRFKLKLVDDVNKIWSLSTE